MPLAFPEARMSSSEWVLIAIFVATQLLTLVGIVSALKGDSRVLQSQMTDVREELKKLTAVTIEQAQHRLMLNQMQDTITLTGKRVDEQSRRLNTFVDAIALSANARALLSAEPAE